MLDLEFIERHTSPALAFVENHYLTQKKDEEEDFLRIKIRIAVTIYGFV